MVCVGYSRRKLGHDRLPTFELHARNVTDELKGLLFQKPPSFLSGSTLSKVVSSSKGSSYSFLQVGPSFEETGGHKAMKVENKKLGVAVDI